jgi:hypothetical protein
MVSLRADGTISIHLVVKTIAANLITKSKVAQKLYLFQSPLAG